MIEKITEEFIVNRIIDFTINKKNGNWHEEKVQKSALHEHGVDIKLVGGRRNSERFFIECKAKSYAKSAKSINREGWLNALGQIITRMDVKKYYVSRSTGQISGINHAYKYGLGLCWESAQVALRRIPKEIAKVLCLHIFSVNDNGEVKYLLQVNLVKNILKMIFITKCFTSKTLLESKFSKSG